ncbi:MAG: hypothetical protein JXQ73_33960 [Phycisphaerae bacterium]|nr:hypothetical protein [Phycisphaerae bacterium]
MWKFQMMLGVVLVLMGVMIALFPQILVALVATAVCMVGAGLMASAWRMRSVQQVARRFHYDDPFDV